MTVPEHAKKQHTCELCGKTDECVMAYVGGYLNYAHGDCAEIANRGVEQYLRYLLVDFSGLEILVKALKNALDEVEGRRHKQQ